MRRQIVEYPVGRRSMVAASSGRVRMLTSTTSGVVASLLHDNTGDVLSMTTVVTHSPGVLLVRNNHSLT